MNRIGAMLMLLATFDPSRLPAMPATPRPEHDVTSQELVFQIPGMDRVMVRRNISFKKIDSGDLKLDLYLPADLRPDSLRPAVVFVNGVGDQPEGDLKDWAPYRSWGRLIAASGWIAVTAQARGPFRESGPDITDLFHFVREKGAETGIDTQRVAAWVCSGNVVSGLKVLMEESLPGVVGAVVYYGSSEPARIRTDLPVFFARAGRDNTQLNAAIDQLIPRAIAAGAPWTVVNAPNSHHAFDVLDETEESRRIIRQTLAFYRELFSPPPPPGAPSSPSRRALAFWFGHEYAPAAAAYGDYVKSHPDDAVAFLRLGLSQAHTGRGEEARRSLEKAVALGADRPLDLFNVACGYALIGETDHALDALDRAVAAGFHNRDLLTTDEDLASLRALPRFQALLARMK